MFSTLLDFSLAHLLEKSEKNRKLLLFISIFINLGFLGIFKYFNFFIDSFADSAQFFGWHFQTFTLKIILPVGISFYTFHGISYIVDVYKKRIAAEKSFIDYAVFVCFFPLLVAGPIERATHLLPQIKKPRNFSYEKSVDALRQILWGFFKKIVVADSCAGIVNKVYHNYAHESSSTLLMAAILFAFQIYCDFSGYTDIALGVARLFGMELLQNFSFPYFSRNIAEFWRRWHISLSSWFRDYVYIPLGGSKVNTWLQIRNVFIIFLISGFWHGANWTFIAWGFLNAVYFLPLLLSNQNRNYTDTVAQNTTLPSLKEFVLMFSTFALTVLAWIFFRAATISDAIQYLANLFTPSIFSVPKYITKSSVFAILLLLVIEWIGRNQKHAIEKFALNWNKIIRIGFYYFILGLIIYYVGEEHPFIYFQF